MTNDETRKSVLGALAGRREFIAGAAALAGGLIVFRVKPTSAAAAAAYDWEAHEWAYAVDTTKCIGCGSCMRACRAENDVPEGNYRTWVERYEISDNGDVRVQMVDEKQGFSGDATPDKADQRAAKAFFVPKLCNHCETSVCAQVCPVGATFRSKDGVVLVDSKHCVGCGYCVQACPYGTRFINPRTHTADKCTLCYHRITKGMKPACVQSCPVGARIFGDIKDPHSDIARILHERRYTLLKPELGTNPRCYYIGLDMEVV